MYFQTQSCLSLAFGSCTEASHFYKMDHKSLYILYNIAPPPARNQTVIMYTSIYSCTFCHVTDVFYQYILKYVRRMCWRRGCQAACVIVHVYMMLILFKMYANKCANQNRMLE